jgi:hypothetical protein
MKKVSCKCAFVLAAALSPVFVQSASPQNASAAADELERIQSALGELGIVGPQQDDGLSLQLYDSPDITLQAVASLDEAARKRITTIFL